MNIFVLSLFRDTQNFLLITLAVIPSICLHEYFHAQTALWLGDDTAANAGHLTLNPLKQMGPLSIITFLIIGIAWGSVPVNPDKLSPKGKILVSLAGPAMNLFLFLASWTAALFLMELHGRTLCISSEAIPKLLALYVFYLGTFNLVLCIFNLLPLPGLDGWKICERLLPLKWRTSEFVKGTMLFVIFGVLLVFPYIFRFADRVMLLAPYLHVRIF